MMALTPWTAPFSPCSAVIGELDEEADAALDLSTLRADPLKPVVH